MKALKNKNPEGELIRVEQAAALINVSKVTAKKIAAASGAERHIGRSYRIKRSTFLDYIERQNIDN